MCTSVYTCVCIRPSLQGTAKGKRGRQKDKSRKKWRRWRHTPSRTSPSPSLSLPVTSFRHGYGRTFLRSLRMDDAPGLWRPLLDLILFLLFFKILFILDLILKSKGSRAPAVTLQSPGLRMGMSPSLEYSCSLPPCHLGPRLNVLANH